MFEKLLSLFTKPAPSVAEALAAFQKSYDALTDVFVHHANASDAKSVTIAALQAEVAAHEAEVTRAADIQRKLKDLLGL